MSTISTNSYTIGQVDLFFDPSVAHASLMWASNVVASGMGKAFQTTGRNFGNIVTAEISPDVSYVEHWISDNGQRKKDKVAVNTVNLTIPFTFDEINAANLKKFFLASSLTTKQLAVFEEPLTEGCAQLVFTTSVGQDMTYYIPKCTIRPDGALSTNAEDWWEAPMVLEVLYYNTAPWATKPYGFVNASAV